MDGESSLKESLRGRFFVRDNDVRSNEAVGVLVGATFESIVADTKYEAGNVVEEAVVFSAQAQFFERTKTATAGQKATKVDVVLGCDGLEKKKEKIDSQISKVG